MRKGFLSFRLRVDRVMFMENINATIPVIVTIRHEATAEFFREYAAKKIHNLELQYPKIIEAKVILDKQKHLHTAEIVLFCANHITLQGTTTHEDMHIAIDKSVAKIARRMRKQKTRLLKRNHPKEDEHIRNLKLRQFGIGAIDHPIESPNDPQPIFDQEDYRVLRLFKEDAMINLELSDDNFIIFKNKRREDALQLLTKKKNGHYAVIDLES